MYKFKANQKLLFKAETVFNLKPLEKYEILFSFLDTSPLEILYPSTGRLPIPYEALFKALIYKNIKNISYLSDLARELQDNPDLALVFGFHPPSLFRKRSNIFGAIVILSSPMPYLNYPS